MAAKDKVVLRGAGAYLALDKTSSPGNTTLTAVAAAGAGTLTVASITGFAVGEWIRVGSGETQEFIQVHTSTAPAGVTITLNTNLRKSHAIGEAVFEQTVFDVGTVLQNPGAVVSFKGSNQEIDVFDSRLAFAILNGFVDADCKFTFPTVSLYSLGAAVGALGSLIQGAGTTASPLQLVSDGTDFAGAANMTLIVVGKLMDNTDIVAYLNAVDADYTGISMPLSRGKFTGIASRFVAAGGGAFDTTVPTFNADTTNKPTKGKVWDALVAAGWFKDAGSGLITTVASGGAAGSSSVTVASGTGAAVGDWVRFGAGNLMEIWQLDSVAGAVLGIRGKFYRNQAVGAAAVEQTLTLFPGVDEDGATFAIGGSGDVMHSALSRTAIGWRAGRVEASVKIPVIETTLANLALSLGIPQSAVSGGRLLADGSNIGTATDINGLYLRGTLLDATNWAIIAAGISLDLSEPTELAITNAGKPNTIMVAGKPSSQLAVLNYT